MQAIIFIEGIPPNVCSSLCLLKVYVQFLTPVRLYVALFRNRVFADVFKLRGSHTGLVQFSSFQLLSRVLLLATPWTTTQQASLSITNSRSLLKLMPIELVMPSKHPSSIVPFFSCLQSFPASGSFPMSQFFTSSGQSIGVSASASVLPMNTQDWFPLEWTGWISLQFKELSRVFSNTTVQKH